MLPEKILKSKTIKAVGKLIIYFLSEQPHDEDGGIKITVADIADGIGEAQKNVRNHINSLKKNKLLTVKGGRYPVMYLNNSICPYEVKLESSIRPYEGKLKNPTFIKDNVVVSRLKKYGFKFGPMTLKKMSSFDRDTQLKAIDYTKQHYKSNPESYINRILDNGCKNIITETVSIKPPPTMSQNDVQTNRIGFLTKMRGTDNFKFYLDMSDIELSNQPEFIKYMGATA